MAAQDTWVLFTKNRALPGCELDMDGCEFYFCEIFIPADPRHDLLNTFEALIGKARNALVDKGFELVDISKIIRMDPLEWEVIGDNGNNVISHENLANTSHSIIFSGFRSDEIEEEVRYKHIIANLD